jgi:hypothetical protein
MNTEESVINDNKRIEIILPPRAQRSQSNARIECIEFLGGLGVLRGRREFPWPLKYS